MAARTILGSRLYWIPGLAFTMKIEDGVRLVIAEGGPVVGRTGFGATICACNKAELVRIL